MITLSVTKKCISIEPFLFQSEASIPFFSCLNHEKICFYPFFSTGITRYVKESNEKKDSFSHIWKCSTRLVFFLSRQYRCPWYMCERERTRKQQRREGRTTHTHMNRSITDDDWSAWLTRVSSLSKQQVEENTSNSTYISFTIERTNERRKKKKKKRWFCHLWTSIILINLLAVEYLSSWSPENDSRRRAAHHSSILPLALAFDAVVQWQMTRIVQWWSQNDFRLIIVASLSAYRKCPRSTRAFIEDRT